jgi:triosephosphate isomerase
MAKKIPWIGTSWKMNKLRAEARAFGELLIMSSVVNMKQIQPFIIPPYPYIFDLADILKNTRVKIGAQNLHWEEKGAWTGEISPGMVRDCGATLVEIGHSERRQFFGETDETVGKKVKAALSYGLTALVCIGDTRSDYEAGASSDVLAKQLRYALRHVGTTAPGKVIIAYEPVWSIGEGGTPADPAFVNEQHKKIKELSTELAGAPLSVIYGGSVSLQNCVALNKQTHVDGLFVGRAAWDVQGYIAIIEAVAKSMEN